MTVNNEAVTGALIATTAEGLILRSDRHEVTLDRMAINRIERRGPSQRKRNALVGFAIGFGAGLALYAKHCNDSCMSEGASVITAPLSAAGAAAGAAWPARRWETIYQAPRLDLAEDWTAIRALAAGTPIKLTLAAGDIQGTFVAANADELLIHVKRGDFSVDRDKVKRLDRRSTQSNRNRNIGLGAGVGFLAGLVRSRFACGGCSAPGGALVTAQSALVGTLVGATASAVKWETVYRRGK